MSEFNGCTDGACLIRVGEPLGQHTNGGCRCLRDIPTPLRIAIKRKLVDLRQQNDDCCEVSVNSWAEVGRLKGILMKHGVKH